MLLTAENQGEYTEEQKTATAADAEKGRKRTRGKLIRLDDLIPEKDVKGGHQVLFGATDTTQTKNNPNK
jgi:hypothetical protein